MPMLTDYLRPKQIIFRDRMYSSEWLWTQVDLLVKWLEKNIHSNSPFVYLFAPNHIKTIVAYFAIIKSGRICVLIDPATGILELEEMRQDTIPAAEINIDKRTICFDYLKEIICTKNGIDAALLKDLDDVCTIVYTAADDGYAKGAMLTNKSLLANAEAIVEGGKHNDSVSFSLLPFHHMFGLQTGVISPGYAKGTFLIEECDDMGSMRRIPLYIEKYRVSHFYSVPLVFHLLTRMQDVRQKTQSVTLWVSGAYKLPLDIFENCEKKCGIEIREGYGLTETSPVCTGHFIDDTVNAMSVGRVFPCCTVSIRNEKNEQVHPGKTGEVCVKGACVMKGYFNRSEYNTIALKDGWFHTGDLGVIDVNRYLYIKGLKKKMINKGGKKVYPKEVCRLIRKIVNVESIEIYEDHKPMLGSTVSAKVTFKPNHKRSSEDIKNSLIGAISPYKIPQIHIEDM